MPRILLIEDDAPLRRALRLTLEKNGHTVVETGDGRAGLEAYSAHAFDLVVTDLIMPEMEGIELIRALRKLDPTPPIIAISGGGRSSPENYLNMAGKFGANLVFAKPFDFEAFSVAVEQLLDSARHV